MRRKRRFIWVAAAGHRLDGAEALCKILCHNGTVLIHEMSALGIKPVFLSRKDRCPKNWPQTDIRQSRFALPETVLKLLLVIVPLGK